MIKPVPRPLNTHEELLHGINVRLEVLIEQFSALSEYIANKDKVAIEAGSTEVVKPARKKRGE
jgi:hypothetical protein